MCITYRQVSQLAPWRGKAVSFLSLRPPLYSQPCQLSLECSEITSPAPDGSGKSRMMRRVPRSGQQPCKKLWPCWPALSTTEGGERGGHRGPGSCVRKAWCVSEVAKYFWVKVLFRDINNLWVWFCFTIKWQRFGARDTEGHWWRGGLPARYWGQGMGILFSRVNVRETGQKKIHNQPFGAFFEKESTHYIKSPEASKYFTCLKSCRWYWEVKIHCIYLQNIREHISNLLRMAYVSHGLENDKVITSWVESQMLCGHFIHFFLVMHGDREK